MSEGYRLYFIILTILTAMIGAFEAILFGMLGDITNWLASSSTKSFFYEKKYEFILLVTFLISGIPLVIIADILNTRPFMEIFQC